MYLLFNNIFIIINIKNIFITKVYFREKIYKIILNIEIIRPKKNLKKLKKL
jgi:hypothetical protein